MPNPPKETQWKKGQSGNPRGRQKGSKNRSTILKEILAVKMKEKNPLNGEEETKTIEEWMGLSMAHEAMMNGNVKAFKEIMDNVYGKLGETMDITGGFEITVSQGRKIDNKENLDIDDLEADLDE